MRSDAPTHQSCFLPTGRFKLIYKAGYRAVSDVSHLDNRVFLKEMVVSSHGETQGAALYAGPLDAMWPPCAALPPACAAPLFYGACGRHGLPCATRQLRGYLGLSARVVSRYPARIRPTTLPDGRRLVGCRDTELVARRGWTSGTSPGFH